MFKFTKAGKILISSLILFLIIFFSIFLFINLHLIRTEINEEVMEIQENFIKPVVDTQEKIENKKVITNEMQIWQIEIPKISLIANISEGTTKEVLENNIGHFDITPKIQGNIGLAGHNRGYSNNFFGKLKLLKEGDEIIYKYNGYESLYEVKKVRIIKDTDWKYLENTEENMLTLITCVENQPEFRRCVQAIEKIKEG